MAPGAIYRFQRLVETVLPKGGYILALTVSPTAGVHGYFDDSGTHESSDFVCVGGYLIDASRTVSFYEQWQTMLDRYGLPFFRMTDCAHGHGNYVGLGPERCDASAREAIGVIKSHVVQGVVLSADRQAISGLLKHGPWTRAYSFLSSQIFHFVQRWAEDAAYEGDVAYFFESGTKGWGEALKYASEVESDPVLKRAARIDTFTSIPKEKGLPTQAADILAWHWYNQYSRNRLGHEKIRADFKSLLEVPTDFHHYGKDASHIIDAFFQARPDEVT